MTVDYKKNTKKQQDSTKDNQNNTKDTTLKNEKDSLQDKQKAIYITSLEAGNTRKQASEDADAGVTTIWEWKQKDKEFAKAIETALESRIQVVEDALFKSATGKEGKAKIIAQIFWLKNRGKNWKDKQDITFIAPKIVKQNSFIQAGEEPVVVEEEEEKEIITISNINSDDIARSPNTPE